MRWVIGLTLTWFVIVSLANLKEFIEDANGPNIIAIWVTILGLVGLFVSLAVLLFRWGI